MNRRCEQEFTPPVHTSSQAAPLTLLDLEAMAFPSLLDDFIADVDILSIHCPRTDETEGMIDAARFMQMKPTAYLINCARGGIVNEEALVKALQTGSITAAGIDVFDIEAPPKDHSLWGLPNVLLSPHIAGVSHASFERMGIMAVENAYKILNGDPIDPNCVVNPSTL